MKKILIIGAYSAMAEATARRWARERCRFHLCGRNADRLHDLAADLRIRGAESADISVLDALDTDRHAETIARAVAAMGGLDLALIAHGTLSDPAECARDVPAALRELNTNALSVISLLTHLAAHFEAQGRGTIAVISSVAGDRGRASNYVYGTAKGAVSLYLQGLRQRLHPRGVHVLTIKPGFVDTPMTAGFRKGPLWASPDRVARGICRAVRRRRDVVYVPFFWRFIMAVVRA
ncbi:MAG: SDR family oxidoreductase, partial [Kiritimatiellae bacterium]|nr:SDR family oxidoreductase [Kiritimatiellia bacterium]